MDVSGQRADEQTLLSAKGRGGLRAGRRRYPLQGGGAAGHRLKRKWTPRSEGGVAERKSPADHICINYNDISYIKTNCKNVRNIIKHEQVHVALPTKLGTVDELEILVRTNTQPKEDCTALRQCMSRSRRPYQEPKFLPAKQSSLETICAGCAGPSTIDRRCRCCLPMKSLICQNALNDRP